MAKIPAEIIRSLYVAVQEACLPGVWSKGVALARDRAVQQDSQEDDEIILRVAVKDRPVNFKVQLWPTEEDWFCDCREKIQPCAHIAAAVVALKTDQLRESESSGDAAKVSTNPNKASRVLYRFSRTKEGLSFDRLLCFGDKQEVLSQSLVGLVGGIQSGRIAMPSLSATKSDFAVDSLLSGSRRGVLDASSMVPILLALADCSDIELDGTPVKILSRPVRVRARLRNDGAGFRVSRLPDSAITEVFRNGAAIKAGALVAVENPALTATEQNLLQGEGRYFSKNEVATLVAEVLPALSQKIEVIIDDGIVLPEVRKIAPHIVLTVQRLSEQVLVVAPRIIYGHPAIAQVGEQGLETLTSGQVVLRDLLAERALGRQVQAELHLQLGQTTKFEGAAALDFLMKSQTWEKSADSDGRTILAEKLEPRIQITDFGFSLSFIGGNANGTPLEADATKVLEAWRRGAGHVSLLGGGWAPLPQDWLSRFGDQIQSLLAAKSKSTNSLPAFLLPDLARLAQDLGQAPPPSLDRMRKRLDDFNQIPDVALPSDFTATLRAYQQKGVNWLCFLRDLGMGALLADDMGLGKTLQALCAIQGKTLIVSPTSVLSSWADHLVKFRPHLRVAKYYGSGRILDLNADVILTTYGLLRLNRNELSSIQWDTVVLDEAQIIRNPQSQVASAAHSLITKFAMALSGTPVENKPEDLWSIFQFINPGLLGTREQFQEQFAQTVDRLRSRIRPFLLRRLKRDVAPELPSRTETVLHCELNDDERKLYDSVLAASRAEVLAQLGDDGKPNVFGALEALLRLRQACCHPKLLPGGTAVFDANSSSKLDLLIETLENSLGQQHRVLIFSQWTSYLDLISAKLAEAKIRHSRLDGSTRDRAAVVNEFQDPSGPPVMIISLKAGGVGLTLTAADHIFIMDPWWNPAVEDQAADRAHRIGQNNPVMIYRLVARDTVEDRILVLQQQKLAVAGAVLEGGAGAAALTRQDILALFET